MIETQQYRLSIGTHCQSLSIIKNLKKKQKIQKKLQNKKCQKLKLIGKFV